MNCSPGGISPRTLQSFWYRGEEMAILWSLCKKTTTFWREVRTMAIILRVPQVCSSLLLIRMLALPDPAHIALPLPEQPTRPQPSWCDARTTQREREKRHAHAPTQLGVPPTLRHKRRTVRAASLRLSLSLSLLKRTLNVRSHTHDDASEADKRRDTHFLLHADIHARTSTAGPEEN